uniref:Integrin beta n=1 Tax=Salarias fasciatus TaxID=181472 RepID=A0A672HV52_SALFA
MGKLLYTVCTFLWVFSAGWCQQEEVCSKSVINSCGDCIRSGPHCVWCQQLNFTKVGAQEAVRCDTRAQLIARGCPVEEIIAPENLVDIVEARPLNAVFEGRELVQMSPQRINLKMRPGLPSSFNVSFKRAEGYPVDLYYLMDLSYSMKDDLAQVKGLGRDLFRALNKITQHGQIGFGAFVDKTVLPYTNTNKEKLEKPCDQKDQQCQPAFGYTHVLSMTKSADEFGKKVSEQFISGNLDSPEGSLDAMMQAAVCGEKIGWRNSSTRLIVLTTDAGFHMAGDGKLAGILEPNDKQCHMARNIYTKSSEMDYPSVGQLATVLEKNNIQLIFAVTKNVEAVYKELSKMIPKSEVGTLQSDSSNVVALIENAYNRLSSKVTLSHDNLPDDVRVVYTPMCTNSGPPGENEGVCDNVGVQEQISFKITVTASSCMTDKSFTIRPQGIRDTLTVMLSTTCDCQCENPSEEFHSHCNYNGSTDCGICRCREGFLGQFCECSAGVKDEQSLQQTCRRDNGTVCEGRGDCVCGRCQCHTTESGTSYHGEFCECDDDHCEKFQNKQCGGNGKCNCGKCECSDGFEGSACQCKTSQDGCRTASNTVCFGRGDCECNRCKCHGGYQPPNCLTCLGCPDQCQAKLNCIECQGFDSGPFKKNCSEACSASIRSNLVQKFSLSGKECHRKDSEGCWITFKLDQLPGKDNYYAEIYDMRGEHCPKPPSVPAIIGGSVALVALIGVAMLLLIKLLIYMNDLKEFKKFENEKKKSKWADNPLFQNATTTVANPTFTGE